MRPLLKLTLFACLCFLSTFSYSRTIFSPEKLYITADTTNYNYKTGITIFTGHVTVNQETHHLTADKLITKQNPHHKIEEILAYGIKQQAHYWKTIEKSEPEIHAHADIIKLYPNQENVIMENNVKIKQGDNIFEGQHVIYNKHDQTITVPQSKNGRAILIYNPEK